MFNTDFNLWTAFVVEGAYTFALVTDPTDHRSLHTITVTFLFLSLSSS